MVERLVLFTANPSEDGKHWYVWDMYQPLPPRPVFVGSMEAAGGVADALNARRGTTATPSRDHPHTDGDRSDA